MLRANVDLGFELILVNFQPGLTQFSADPQAGLRSTQSHAKAGTITRLTNISCLCWLAYRAINDAKHEEVGLILAEAAVDLRHTPVGPYRPIKGR